MLSFSPVSVHVEVRAWSSGDFQTQKDRCVWALLQDGSVIAGDYKDDEGTASSAHVKLLRYHGIRMEHVKAAGSLKNGEVKPNSCLNKIINEPRSSEALRPHFNASPGPFTSMSRYVHRTSPVPTTSIQAAGAREFENTLGKHPCDMSDCRYAAEALCNQGYTVRKNEDDEYIIKMPIDETASSY
jgi:hypothetical protein